MYVVQQMLACLISRTRIVLATQFRTRQSPPPHTAVIAVQYLNYGEISFNGAYTCQP
jgi:hypothetical protein